MDTDTFIQALPKAELHLHIEGAVPWEFVCRSAGMEHSEPPPWHANDFRFDDFEHFSRSIKTVYGSLTDLEAYHLAARHMFSELLSQNVRYVELSFSPDLALSVGLKPSHVAATLKGAALPGLVVAVICGLHRRLPPDPHGELLEDIFTSKDVDGIDLHGNETTGDARPFASIFRRARQRNLKTKAHAGELLGPESVRESLDLLEVSSIEHGIACVRDEILMRRIEKEGIVLDICPTSNLKLGLVEQMQSHPIQELHRRGIKTTVSTDDPTVFGCSLTSELRTLVDVLDFSTSDLATLQVNAFESARLPVELRTSILAEIDALVRDAGPQAGRSP